MKHGAVYKYLITMFITMFSSLTDLEFVVDLEDAMLWKERWMEYGRGRKT